MDVLVCLWAGAGNGAAASVSMEDVARRLAAAFGEAGRPSREVLLGKDDAAAVASCTMHFIAGGPYALAAWHACAERAVHATVLHGIDVQACMQGFTGCWCRAA